MTDQPNPDIDAAKAAAREGARALHARATSPQKLPQLTDAESAAIARARIDKQRKP